ncbi:MAG: exodeoxyribonuclease VII small subunit [Candidatus Binataceae bacterium]
MAARSTRKFEEELKDLEEIVARIDSGDLSLEDSIAAFERGVALVRSLNQKLDDAERKVEVLIKTTGGELKTVEFEDDSATQRASDAAAESAVTAEADKDDDIPF